MIDATADLGHTVLCYVDDELYVARETPASDAYANFQNLTVHVVGDLAKWLRAATDEARHRRRAGGDGRARGRDEGAVRRPALHREVSPPLPRVRRTVGDEGRGARVRSRAAGLRHARPPLRSVTGRTTSSCSSGPATASPSRTPTSACWRSRTTSVPPWTRRAWRKSSRRFRRLTAMIDLRAARSDPDAFRAALAPQRRRRAASTRCSPPMRAGARRARAATRCAPSRSGWASRRRPRRSRRRSGSRTSFSHSTTTGRRRARAARALGPGSQPAHECVPEGEEDDVLEVRRSGEPPAGDEQTEHTEIGRFDMERAAKVSGSRFGYWIGDTALLALALYRLALGPPHRARASSRCCRPCSCAKARSTEPAGCPPPTQLYKLEGEDLYLAGTAEIPLGGLHGDEVLDADALPLRYVGFSPCFRSEAGAAGKDTSGMFRVHQFNKVEQFVFTRPEDSWDEHECLLANTEALVDRARCCPTASSSCRPATCPRRRRRHTTSRSGSRHTAVSARRPRSPTRPTTRRGGWHALPLRARPRAGAHAQRHRGRRPNGARHPRELPGRRTGRASGLRGAARIS